jgi:hypothetical protein
MKGHFGPHFPPGWFVLEAGYFCWLDRLPLFVSFESHLEKEQKKGERQSEGIKQTPMYWVQVCNPAERELGSVQLVNVWQCPLKAVSGSA